jgi:hypothetical protein
MKGLESITQNGTLDTVWREEQVCLWVRNHGEQLIVSVDYRFSDKELIEKFEAYLKWRRQNPSPSKP